MASANKGYVRLNIEDDFDVPSSSGSSNAAGNPFVSNVFQQQKIIMDDQDRGLDKIGTSLKTLREMSNQIGTELDEQSEMLDDLGHAMSSTEARMNNVMKKLAKLTHMDDDARQWKAIFALVALIIILLFILVIF